MNERLNRFEVLNVRVCGARWMASLAVIVVVLMTQGRAFAQSTFGSVRGVAQDNTGGTLPDTQVTLHSLDENTTVR
jgi:hypothetical protein